jgi:transcriptional regulator with XRE-family HTH domain
MELSERIRRSRRHLGVTQSELARLMRVDRSSVSHWESGKRNSPDHRRLASLARLCNVSFEWLATGRGEMVLERDSSRSIPAAFGKLVDDVTSIRLLRALERMAEHQRLLLVELAESIAAQARPRRARSPLVVKIRDGFYDPETGQSI